MNRFRWVIRLLGLALFAAILYVVDVPHILSTLAKANFWLVGLSIVLVVPHLITKAWRWQVLLRSVGIDINLIEATRLYAIGQAAGFLTPGQAGDAVKAVYLRGAGHSLGRSLVTVVVDRLYDLLVVGGLAVWGVFVFGQVPQGQTAIIVLLVAAILLLFVLFSSRGWQGPAARLIARVVPQRFLKGRDPQHTLESLVLPRPALAQSFAITVISFVISYFRSWLLFAALGPVCAHRLLPGRDLDCRHRCHPAGDRGRGGHARCGICRAVLDDGLWRRAGGGALDAGAAAPGDELGGGRAGLPVEADGGDGQRERRSARRVDGDAFGREAMGYYLTGDLVQAVADHLAAVS